MRRCEKLQRERPAALPRSAFLICASTASGERERLGAGVETGSGGIGVEEGRLDVGARVVRRGAQRRIEVEVHDIASWRLFVRILEPRAFPPTDLSMICFSLTQVAFTAPLSEGDEQDTDEEHEEEAPEEREESEIGMEAEIDPIG